MESFIKGATITLAVAKVLAFAFGGANIISLLALQGTMGGVKGVSKVWSYLVKGTQVRLDKENIGISEAIMTSAIKYILSGTIISIASSILAVITTSNIFLGFLVVSSVSMVIMTGMVKNIPNPRRDISSIDIIKTIALLHASKLIQKIPKHSLRRFLFEKGLISKCGMVRKAKSEIIKFTMDAGLIDDAIFIEVDGHYSWHREIIRIINRNDYYPITIETTRQIFAGQQGLGQKTIDILIDYLLSLNDPTLSAERQIQLIKLIDDFCLQNGFISYQDFKKRPLLILFSEVRKIISKQGNKFLTFAKLGEQILGYRIYHKAIDDGEFGFVRVRQIYEYCKANIKSKKDFDYIMGIIQAISILKGDFSTSTNNEGFFKYLTLEPHLKDVEIYIIEKIRTKLQALNIWKGSKPTLSELEDFLEVRFHSISSESERRQFLRVFKSEEINQILKKLKITLGKVDPNGYRDLVDEFSQYNPKTRVNQIEKTYVDFDCWLSKKQKLVYGDTLSKHPKVWKTNKFQNLVREVLFPRQGGFITSENNQKLYHVFDGFTGKVFTWKNLIFKPFKDLQTGEIILKAVDENGIEVAVIHHIDFDKKNNQLGNYLWILAKNHKTNLNEENRRKYIALGMIASNAFDHGYAPRFWPYEAQVEFNAIISKRNTVPSGDTVLIQDDEVNQLKLSNFLGV